MREPGREDKNKTAMELTDPEYDELWRRSQPIGTIIKDKTGTYRIVASGKWVRIKVKG